MFTTPHPLEGGGVGGDGEGDEMTTRTHTGRQMTMTAIDDRQKIIQFQPPIADWWTVRTTAGRPVVLW
jgi:hypothetical protein